MGAAIVGAISKAVIGEAAASAAEAAGSEQLEGAIEAAQGAEQAATDVSLKVIDIKSDTWYTYHLADKQNWIDSNRKWAEIITREATKQYFAKARESGVIPNPVMITAYSSRDGLNVTCNSVMGKSFDKELAREAIMSTIRGTYKAYIRSVAAGGADLPTDYVIGDI